MDRRTQSELNIIRLQFEADRLERRNWGATFWGVGMMLGVAAIYLSGANPSAPWAFIGLLGIPAQLIGAFLWACNE